MSPADTGAVGRQLAPMQIGHDHRSGATAAELRSLGVKHQASMLYGPARTPAASLPPRRWRRPGGSLACMSQRQLFIAAYDVSSDLRLREALKVLKGYASGRQKSVFECFLTDAERRALLSEVATVLDAVEDRFLLLRLEPRGKVRVRGKGLKPVDPPWFYVG